MHHIHHLIDHRVYNLRLQNREVKDKPIRGPFSQGPQGRRDDRPARGPPPYRPRRSFTPSLHQARLAVQRELTSVLVINLKLSLIDFLDPITLETTYHPNVLADHRGRIFKRHRDVSLIQRDNRNERNELILPWKVESSFREGTLCIALVSFKMFNVTRRMDYETHHVGGILGRRERGTDKTSTAISGTRQSN